MKTFLIAGLLAASLATPAFATDPIEGVWRSQPNADGHWAFVTITSCGAQICGTLGQAYDTAGQKVDSPNIGKPLIWGMQAQGGGTYGGGKIWAPDDDKTYKSKMQLVGDQLTVKGCVLAFCRGQTWTRQK